MVITVPPEPIAALGDQDFLTRARESCRRETWRGRLQRAARLSELTPRAVVVVVADPDVEVAVDPRTGEYRRQAIRSVCAGLAHRDGSQVRMRGQTRIERAEEWPALAWVVLPGVLAVQNHRDRRLLASRSCRVPASGVHQAAD